MASERGGSLVVDVYLKQESFGSKVRFKGGCIMMGKSTCLVDRFVWFRKINSLVVQN